MENEKRLKFLLRRGMKELDVMVERYYRLRYADAEPSERDAFVRLLSEVEDPDIWSWTMGNAPVPDEYASLVAELRIFR